MWAPRDAEDVERAVAGGDLEETASFDGKVDLPKPKRNVDLAIDVAAMSTDGGLLLYGVGEDENGQLTELHPMPLAGVADRIGQIVATSIAEVPHIEVSELPCSADPSTGFISVLVPQSARAPHQVTVGGDLRFYGRGAKGNRRLGQGEIARLYQRRNEWAQDRDALLVEAIGQSPFDSHVDRGYLHAFTRPVAPDRSIWERAEAAAGGRQELQKALTMAIDATRPNDGYAPTLKGGHEWKRQGADEWKVSTRFGRDYADVEKARYVVEARINIDGRSHLFCGRAAERRSRPDGQEGEMLIFESIIAGNFVAYLIAMGTIYSLAGYHGHVDLGFRIDGLRNGYGASRMGDMFFAIPENAYNADSYPRTERVAASELLEPETVARRMLRHLFEATSGQADFDPFE